MRPQFILLGAGILLTACKSAKPVDEVQREQALGITCETALTVSGSFTAGSPAPSNFIGCWGDGTWSFKASVTGNQCASPPHLESQYQMTLSHDANNTPVFQYLNDPNNTDTIMRVTAGGGSICEGELTLFNSAGTVVTTLKPHLYTDGHISGQGTVAVYQIDQR